MFCSYLKDAVLKNFSLGADVFVSRKKKHVHIAFKIPISEYGSFGALEKMCNKNSRCHIQNLHPQILFGKDISVEKGTGVPYCQEEERRVA